MGKFNTKSDPKVASVCVILDFLRSELDGTKSTENVAEDLTDSWAKQGQDDDNDNCDQDQDQSVFYETLAFFILRAIQHDNYLFKHMI